MVVLHGGLKPPGRAPGFEASYHHNLNIWSANIWKVRKSHTIKWYYPRLEASRLADGSLLHARSVEPHNAEAMRTICVICAYRGRAHQLLENRKNNKKLGIKANWSSCLYLQRQRSAYIAEEAIVKEANEQIASKMNGNEWQTSFFTPWGV